LADRGAAARTAIFRGLDPDAVEER